MQTDYYWEFWPWSGDLVWTGPGTMGSGLDRDQVEPREGGPLGSLWSGRRRFWQWVSLESPGEVGVAACAAHWPQGSGHKRVHRTLQPTGRPWDWWEECEQVRGVEMKVHRCCFACHVASWLSTRACRWLFSLSWMTRGKDTVRKPRCV